MSHRAFPRIRRAAAVVASIALLALFVPQVPASAAAYARIYGDGSSWAGPAIDQWSTDVVGRGIHIDYSPDGSAAGRQNYIVGQNDFAGSDIQFLTQGDPFGGGAESSSLAYSYIPIVAGGTAFMYNLVVGGRKITDLRLSGQTIAKIFTGQVTNWSDPAITHDYGAQLPSQPITVITRADGSGASYQFTRYLSKSYPSIWNAFCAAHGGPNPCGPTEFYPSFGGSQQKNGSDQVASFVASPTYGEGSIAYDEYAYAKEHSLPVVKLLNSAGYFNLPTASNVAVALQAAQIDENINDVNFLIQNLDNVYTDSDPRAYPLSSYSYLIVPRDSRPNTNGPPPGFTKDKGTTLSTWLNYVLCGAQQEAGGLGYSPLPKNLVVGGFEQVVHIPGSVGIPNLSNLNGCENPTYSDGVNHLITGAPQPSPCDRLGAPLDCVVRNGRAVANGAQAPGTGNGSTTGTQAGSGGGGGTGTGSTGGGGTGAAATGGGTVTGRRTTTTGSGTASSTVDPVTGEQTGGGTTGQQSVQAAPVSLTGTNGGGVLFSVLTALELLAAVLVPAALGTWLQRRRRSGP